MSSPQRTTKTMASLPLISWRTTPSIKPSSISGSSLLGIFMVRIVRCTDATTILVQNLSVQPPLQSVMSRYQVRSAIPRDAMAIADIYAAAVQASYKDLVPDELLSTLFATKRQGY